MKVSSNSAQVSFRPAAKLTSLLPQNAVLDPPVDVFGRDVECLGDLFGVMGFPVKADGCLLDLLWVAAIPTPNVSGALDEQPPRRWRLDDILRSNYQLLKGVFGG
jgi:hypothetical protein